jgi:hypothetical protein
MVFSFFGRRITVRWMASSLEEFRRATSKIATFVILASIPLFIFASLLPREQPLRGMLILYLILALILKVTIRRSAVDSLTAVRVIEIAFFAALLMAGLSVAYFVWIDGLEGLIPSVANVATLAIAAFVAGKNISGAKSMALQAQTSSGSQLHSSRTDNS